MATVNEMGSLSLGYGKGGFSESALANSFRSAPRAALLDVGFDNSNGEGAVMSSPSNDAHSR
jgi:hypothetical protein